ncbi:hypothetical protein PQ689_03230 [Thermoanaerobacterium thermosaccharolyticum]|uniref:hypothetical protein n=1 Tax=Thermoanaerobacterium thermosaccharolyticum TaxID=1517 RepID=UPI003D2D6C71
MNLIDEIKEIILNPCADCDFGCLSSISYYCQIQKIESKVWEAIKKKCKYCIYHEKENCKLKENGWDCPFEARRN